MEKSRLDDYMKIIERVLGITFDMAERSLSPFSKKIIRVLEIRHPKKGWKLWIPKEPPLEDYIIMGNLPDITGEFKEMGLTAIGVNFINQKVESVCFSEERRSVGFSNRFSILTLWADGAVQWETVPLGTEGKMKIIFASYKVE